MNKSKQKENNIFAELRETLSNKYLTTILALSLTSNLMYVTNPKYKPKNKWADFYGIDPKNSEKPELPEKIPFFYQAILPENKYSLKVPETKKR